MGSFKTIRLIGLLLLLLSLVTCTGDFSGGGSPALRIQALVGSELVISNASGDQQNPHVIYLPDKNLYFAVYEDWSNPSTGADIKGRFIKHDGTFCGDELTITDSAGNQTLPRAAYRDKDLLPSPSGNDTILVVWQDARDDGTGGYVYYRGIDVTNIDINNNCPTTSFTIGLENSIGYTQIQAYSSSTISILGPVNQNIGTGDGSTKDFTAQLNNRPVVPGSITINVGSTLVCRDNEQGGFTGGCSGSIIYETGSLNITFTDAPSNGATISVTYYYYSSWPPGTQFINDQLLSRKSPKVVYDPSRDLFWISYVESRDTLNRLSELCFGFAPVSWEVGDNSFIGYVRLNGSNLSVSGQPEIIRNGPTRTNRLISSSREALKEIYEYEFFTAANNPDLGIDITSPETLFVFEGVRQKGVLTCNCKDNNNNGVCDLADTVTSEFTTSNYDDGKVHIYGLFDKEIEEAVIPSKKIDASPSHTYYPSVGFDPITKRFLVAWEDLRDDPNSNTNTKIYGQLLYSGGGLYNENFILSYQDTDDNKQQDPEVANSKQTKPFVGYDSVNQRYFVVWQDGRNGTISEENLDIYGQSVDGEGSLRGSNYFISQAPANQWNPVVAYNSQSREFLALWKDGRNTSSTGADIYGQRFTLGQPQLTVLRPDNTLLFPSLLDFGLIMNGQRSSLSFKIRNTGDASLKIDCFDPYPLSSPFEYETTLDSRLQACNDNQYVEFIPTAEQTFTIFFAPTTSGNFTGSFTIKSDGGNKTISLQGRAGEPDIRVSPDTIDFGTVSLPASKTFTISNTGNFSLTITEITTSSPFSVSGFTLPLTLEPNETQSVTVTFSPSTGGTYSGQVTISSNDPDTPTISVRLNGVYAPLEITTTGLKPWTKDVAGYSETLQASGGSGGYNWSIVSGNLPTGLTLNAMTGEISGTPTLAGNYEFKVRVTDGTGAYKEKDFTIRINEPLEITTAALPNGTKGEAYSVQITYRGGTAPYSWAASGLPSGLTIDAATGVISGTPTEAGTFNVRITLTDAAGASVQKEYVLTIYTPPDIDVTPTSFNFGDVGIGLSKDIVVTIKNIGEAPLTISTISLNGSGFEVILPSLPPFNLEQGASLIFTIRFQPSANTNYSGKLTIRSNDPDEGELNYTLTGSGVNQPDIDVAPSIVDFGTVIAGTSKDVTITIKNNIASGADLVISNIIISGNGFTIPSPPTYPITLSAGSTTTITVRFTPPTSGQFSGSLTIQSNDPDEGSFTVQLNGSGLEPPDITVVPASLDFGDVLLNQSKTLTLTINNNGGSELQINDITISGTGFSFKTQPQSPIIIQPGGTPVSIEIIFIPTEVKLYSGQVSITSNDPDSPTTITLTGKGISAPNIEVTPDSLDFGKVQINTTSDKTVTIKNTGTQDLNISGISILGSQAFSIVSTIPTQIPVGEARTVTVRFSPTGEVPYAGYLVINSNDPETPALQVPLKGEGTSQVSGGGGENISTKGGGCSVGGTVNGPSAVANMVVLLTPLLLIGLRRIGRRK